MNTYEDFFCFVFLSHGAAAAGLAFVLCRVYFAAAY